MAQRVVTSFINTNIPGAYPNISVKSNPSSLGASGNVVIFGEADGGDSYQNVALKDNFFTTDQLDKVQETYLSGQIVDAFRAFSAPSADAGITGSANRIYIVKTNSGTQASAIVDTDYGTFVDQNWGTPGNKYKYQITSIATEMTPTVSGTTIPAFGAPLNGDSFSIRLNGGAATVVTLSGTASDHNNIANLILELNRYTFTVTAANATAGAVYTNNGQSFTVLSTIVAGTTLQTTGTGTPLASGTLTKISGTGDATIAFSAFSRHLPEGIVASAGTATDSLKLTMSVDLLAYRKGWGKSFELFDSTAGDLAALGLVAGLSVTALEPGIEVSISRPDIGLSETLDVNAEIALKIGYLGTTATVTINQTTKTLSTTVVGGAGTSIASLDLTQYRTIADLASYLAAQTGYSAEASASAQQLAPNALDEVTSQGIASSGSGLEPGRIKKSAFDFQKVMATSSAFTFIPTAKAGLPSPMASPVFLSGGLRGATLAADIVNAINQLAGINVNIVVPLFSRDAAADIADGLTDSASTYTVDAINAAVKSHCIQYSTPKLKKNRICFLSYWNDNYADAKTRSQGLANYRCILVMQRATQVNSAGLITDFMPWFNACVAAGMQAGGFYKSICNKFANVVSFTDPSGFDSGSPGDVEDALDAGLQFLTKDTAGNRWVSDQTTYGFDTNFVYNSIQAVYCSDILALDLAASFQSAFVGQSLADVGAASALAFLSQKMAGYYNIKLIASSSDAPLGFKNAKIKITAPEMDVSVEIKLATAIYFIPISINISQIQQTA